VWEIEDVRAEILCGCGTRVVMTIIMCVCDTLGVKSGLCNHHHDYHCLCRLDPLSAAGVCAGSALLHQVCVRVRVRVRERERERERERVFTKLNYSSQFLYCNSTILLCVLLLHVHLRKQG